MRLDGNNQDKYEGDPYEEIGRQITAADGVKESVVMQKFYWDYLDWLIDAGAADLQRLLQQLDLERGSRPLGETLTAYLYEGLEYRTECGLPQPPWLQI